MYLADTKNCIAAQRVPSVKKQKTKKNRERNNKKRLAHRRWQSGRGQGAVVQVVQWVVVGSSVVFVNYTATAAGCWLRMRHKFVAFTRDIYYDFAEVSFFLLRFFCLFYECGKWKMEIEEENCMMHHWMRLLLMDVLSQTFGSNCKSYSGL